jgi:glycosyltransferase involved in cell wall biosynthesis
MTQQLQDSNLHDSRAKAEPAPMRIGYVLCYRDPDYIRTRSILQALGLNLNTQVLVASNTHKGIRRYFEVWRALRRIKESAPLDVCILGFRGHEIFWPVIRMMKGVPLVFDALMSPYGALREERKFGLIGALLAPLVYTLERSILERAELVLTDTQLHANYFEQTFSMSPSKILALPVGAIQTEPSDEVLFERVPSAFTVLFYGSFLPLHGISVVVKAAAMLNDLPIQFDFIGGNARHEKQLKAEFQRLGLKNYTHRRWVPMEKLLDFEITRASLCLGGPFGGTPQASRVITGKASQCIALGKATVIGRIEEDDGFIDRVNCLLVEQADPKALAEAIRWAYMNRETLADIGARGRLLYNSRLSIHTISERLMPRLRRIVAKGIA